jgi:flagellar protein FliS
VTATKAADVYRQNAVLTASPEKLVVLLYEGAIRHMEKCRLGLSDPATRRNAATGESLGKAYSIIGELRSTLDHEAGGEIAANLDRLYDFTLEQLHEANVNRNPEPVENGLRVMRTLKEAWDGILPG